MTKVHLVAVATVACLLVLGASCGDDDDATPTTSPTAATTTASATATPTPSPTPSPSPSASPTQPASRNADSFTYVTSAGDTLDAIARAFNGQPGTAKAGFPDQIRSLNPQVSWPNPPVGTEVIIPLLQTDPGSLIPYASMQLALGIQGTGGLEVQEPSAALMDGFRGQLALHRVTLANPTAAGGAGYLMEFWLTDRRFLKGDELDREALVTSPAFVVGGGSLASQVTGTTGVFTFEQSSVPYAVKTLAGAGGVTAEQVASTLAVAPHQP